jgi:hypothetical protein
MSLIESPTQAGVAAEVGRTFRAIRTEVRPLEYKNNTGELVGGHYRTVGVTGLITILNAGDPIFSLQWTSQNKFFVLHKLRLWSVITTAFGAAQEVSFDLVKLTGFVAPDTGGTSLRAALAGGASRKHNVMNPSSIADVRIAAAVALGLGTAVADALPIGFCALPIGNAVGSSASDFLTDVDEAGGEHPILLQQNEGIRSRVAFTQGAGGVMRVTLSMDWTECASYAA